MSTVKTEIITDFSLPVIQKAQACHVSLIHEMMEEALVHLPDPSWYVADDETFIRRHIETAGFTLLAFCDRKPAGFLIVRIPGKEEDNLGSYLCSEWEKNHLDPMQELLMTAHMESVVVRPAFRGHGIQKALLREAIRLLQEQDFHHLMATVHPDNLASLSSFQACGFQILSTVKKYGGLRRHILYQSLALL
jgi:L-amino acid N-acyltransferase YncA